MQKRKVQNGPGVAGGFGDGGVGGFGAWRHLQYTNVTPPMTKADAQHGVIEIAPMSFCAKMPL